MGKFLKGSPLFRQMVATVVMLALLLPSLPSTTYAAVDVGIRQEINLIDGYFTATSGNFATTSAIINIDTNQYNDASYYFEAVASTTGAASRLLLRNATTFATVTSVDVSGTTAIRYRSGTAFTPTAGANDYVAVWENQSVGKSAQAIRVVILQNAASITDTETQIELGSEVIATTSAITTPLSQPKYWYYDASKWDGTVSFAAEVTYQLTQAASSTIYAVPGTYRHMLTPNVSYLTVEAWGAGGGGSLQTNTGGGGGGGAYAASTFATTTGAGTIVVGVGGTSDNAAAATDSTYNNTANGTIDEEVIADAGLGASAGAGVAGGNLTNTVGHIEFVGGNGGTSDGGNDVGGGGGGAGGPDGAGNMGFSAIGGATSGSDGGSGDAGSGGAGGNNATCGSGGDGGPGVDNALGGGGGGGSDTACTGGVGGKPGGGGGGEDLAFANVGGSGQVKLTETHGRVGIALEEGSNVFGGWTFKQQIVKEGVSTTTPERVRVTFTPTTGKNYRLVASSTNSGVSYSLYNAKIVVNQTGTITKLEPQYLLANKTLAPGTALQNYFTYWDPSEWSGVTNTYFHEASSQAGGTSDTLIQNTSGPATIACSDIANVVHRATSTVSGMNMPGGVATLDVLGNANGGDLYSSRIIVRTVVNPPAITISGRVFTDEGVTQLAVAGKVIKARFGTTTAGIFSTSTIAANGFWQIPNIFTTSFFLGMPIHVWMDGDASFRAFTFTKASSTSAYDIKNLDLYRSRVIVKHEATTGTSTTNADLGAYDADDDGDIQYYANGGTLEVKKEQELHIAAGSEFAPGGAVTLHGNASTTNPDGDLHLPTGLRQDGVASTSILTMAANNLTLAGSWFASSTSIFFQSELNGVVFNSTSTVQKIIVATTTEFFSINFTGTNGAWTFGSNAATTTDIALTSGTVTAPSTSISIGRSLYKESGGSFIHNSGTVIFNSTSGGQGIGVNNPMVASNAFNNIIFRNVALKSFDSMAASTTNFTIESGSARVTLPSTNLTVSGNFTNNSANGFAHNNGTVFFGTTTVSLLGSLDNIAGVGNPALAALNSTDVAFIDHINQDLRTYRWNGSTWTLLGSLDNIATVGTNPALAALNSTDVAFIDSTNDDLRTYRFNGTTWTLLGSLDDIANVDFSPALAALNSTDVAFIDLTNDDLRTYRWNGSTWTLLGSLDNISTVGVPALAALNSTDVAFIDDSNKDLRTYRWNGSTWTLLGSLDNIAGVSSSALAALNSTDVAFIDANNQDLRTYRWNGSTWTLLGSLDIAGVDNPALAALNSTDVAFIDWFNDDLRTYRIGGTATGTMTGASAWNNLTIVGKAAFGTNASTTNLTLLNASSTLTAPPLLSIGGNFTNSGTFSSNSGTVYFSTTSPATQTLSGTMTGGMMTTIPTAWNAFHNVQFVDSGTKSFGANASTTGSITIQSGSGAVTAPPLLSIGGNYTNSGTFTAGTGTVYLNGYATRTAQTLSGTMTGTSAFRDLTILNTSGTGGGVGAQSVVFANAASTTGLFTMVASTSARFTSGSATSSFNGISWNGSASSPVWLRSSSGGTPWGLVATNTQAVSYVNVKDSYACAGNSIDVTNGTDSGGNNCWNFLSFLTFSGRIYTDEGVTQLTTAGKTIRVRVGTTTAGLFATSTIAANGFWQIPGILNNGSWGAGRPVHAWVDGDPTFRAFTFTKASSTSNNITNLDLYKNYVIVKHEAFTGTSTTNADLGVYDADDDEDIQFRVTGANFAQKATNTLYIAPGTTYAPGGTVTLHGNAGGNGDGDLRLATGLRQDGVASTSILTLGNNSIAIAGNWFASSTSIFTSSVNAFIDFNSTSTAQKSIIATSSPFGYLSFNGSGGSWTFGANAATTSTHFELNAGTVIAPSISLSWR